MYVHTGSSGPSNPTLLLDDTYLLKCKNTRDTAVGGQGDASRTLSTAVDAEDPESG